MTHENCMKPRLPASIVKFHWHTATLICISYGCFHITTADLGYSSDSMTYKAESIEYLTLC